LDFAKKKALFQINIALSGERVQKSWFYIELRTAAVLDGSNSFEVDYSRGFSGYESQMEGLDE